MATISEAIEHIESLWPPDSEYEDTAAVGRSLMDSCVGTKVAYEDWRNLDGPDLFSLAKENLLHEGEHALAFDFCFYPHTTPQPDWHAALSS